MSCSEEAGHRHKSVRLDWDKVQDLSNDEIVETLFQIKADIHAIQMQLETNGESEVPGWQDTQEWRISARKALKYKLMDREKLKGELTKRNGIRAAEKARRKLEKIRTPDCQKSQDAAFVAAARKYLTGDEFQELWELAEKWFPESFGHVDFKRDESQNV